MLLNDWNNIVTLVGPNPVGTNSFQVTSKVRNPNNYPVVNMIFGNNILII